MKKTLFILLLGVSSFALADQAKDIDTVKKELFKIVNSSDMEIKPSPIKGVYQASIQGEITYVFVDGDHVLIGDLYNTTSKVNIGDSVKAELMASTISSVPVTKMIVFGPQNAKRHITVFTDIDCGYCRKLHNEVPALTEAGIQVRYLAFPRAGINSESYDKYVSVWCNTDQQTSLTAAKNGKPVNEATCDNPVAESYKLGQEVGVRGTPTIILDNGSLVPGYMPANALLKKLGIEG